jgi:hypothetical protein
MNYISIIPATDWFFVQKNDGGGAEFIIHHLAAWALTEDGESVGLLPVSDPKIQGKTTAKLIEPPPINGEYIHKEQLTNAMLKCLKS